jgi:hypothetical protein
MEIRISLDRLEPPAGRLWRVEGEKVPFSGWLGLLRALYQVVGPPDGRPPDGG